MFQTLAKRADLSPQILRAALPLISVSAFSWLLLQDAIRPVYLLLLQLYLAF